MEFFLSHLFHGSCSWQKPFISHLNSDGDFTSNLFPELAPLLQHRIVYTVERFRRDDKLLLRREVGYARDGRIRQFEDVGIASLKKGSECAGEALVVERVILLHRVRHVPLS